MTVEEKHVAIYTDGACSPNPGGPGGYGVLLIYKGRTRELSGGFRSTTNNRMEMYAAVKALEALKQPCRVTLHSDSEYLVKAMKEGWAQRWKANGWWRNKQERAVNVDLWERLLALCDGHRIEFVWVRGHSGHTENERCDHLATEALKQQGLPPDENYENRPPDEGKKAKVSQEGQPCRKCSAPVVKRVPRKRKQSGAYYYEYYLLCPSCGTMYMVEDAKRCADLSLSLL
jgi:ribonuclease HI